MIEKNHFTRELPRYASIEKIHALQVSAIIPNPRGQEVHFTDMNYAPVLLGNWVLFMDIEQGDYAVFRASGKVEFMSPEAFKATYEAESSSD